VRSSVGRVSFYDLPVDDCIKSAGCSFGSSVIIDGVWLFEKGVSLEKQSFRCYEKTSYRMDRQWITGKL
jgi:hypothetical protein